MSEIQQIDFESGNAAEHDLKLALSEFRPACKDGITNVETLQRKLFCGTKL